MRPRTRDRWLLVWTLVLVSLGGVIPPGCNHQHHNSCHTDTECEMLNQAHSGWSGNP